MKCTEIYTLSELIPIVLGVLIWAEGLRNRNLLLHIDNLSLVYIVNHKSSNNNRIMKLVRLLVLQTLKYNIQIRAQHITGIKNQIEDAISRFPWTRFRQLAPGADLYPSKVLPENYSGTVDRLLQASYSMNTASMYCQGLQVFSTLGISFHFKNSGLHLLIILLIKYLICKRVEHFLLLSAI